MKPLSEDEIALLAQFDRLDRAHQNFFQVLLHISAGKPLTPLMKYLLEALAALVVAYGCSTRGAA